MAPSISCHPGRWRRAVQHGLLALALAASGGADACTLDALLRLPLERLLQLDIAVRRVSRNASFCALEPQCPTARGEPHAA